MDFGKLHIENFGPFKKADIDLGRVNVFIGPQGVGKSVIGKLISLLGNESESEESCLNKLIVNYFNLPSTKKISQITLKVQDVLERNLLDSNFTIYNHIFDKNFKEIDDIYTLLKNNFEKLFDGEKDDDSTMVQNLLEKTINSIKFQSLIQTIYIPEDRGIFARMSGDSIALMRNIKFEEYILDFAQNLQRAKNSINELEANFLNRQYEFNTDADFSTNTLTNEKINLKNEASGIKNLMPILAVCKYYSNIKANNKNQKFHFIIEEPELNLYPKTQVALMTYLIGECIKNEHQLTITTHSPYMLTAINNLCMAYQAGQVNEAATNKVVPKSAWINPAEVSAYHVENGTVRSIFNKEAGLIAANEIDDASDDIIDVFDELCEIYAENLKKA